VSSLWQEIKAKEKQGKPQARLDAIKPGPSLSQAEAIQKNAAKIGFDFNHVQDAYGKLEEELAELQQAIRGQNSDEIQDEFGDCLFSLVNVGRKLGVSSEHALLGTIHKFRSRFAYIEQQASLQGKCVDDMTLQEMDQLWEAAKQQRR
jgi:MazG family protein